MTMKKNILFFITCGIVLVSCAQKTVDYNVKRTDNMMGDHKLFTYELRNDSIIVTKFSTNNKPPKIVYSSILSGSQKSKLCKILNGINLSEMKNSYANNTVEGEGNSVYDIRIAQESISIYVYYVDVPELKKIDDFINDILPSDQNGWYDSY